ncbi:hypothetical protein O181_076224 [Austropuccinia psidii MF-1]|uniref:Ribosomal eL28/Mak16 domain-containing protein n=1 Tax=Austropuccinia psidii MF-1 TaxID=1389203 RepID=A0A9Q3FCI4_9BASI|nr:hypothetical protein [Austropuccinia psidii MF-1]
MCKPGGQAAAGFAAATPASDLVRGSLPRRSRLLATPEPHVGRISQRSQRITYRHLQDMDNASSTDLQWFLLRGWNSKVVKRGAAGFTFSSEAGNLKNKHSYKYSGLVQKKPLSISAAPSGGVLLTTRKDSANPRHVQAGRSTIRIKGGMVGTRKAAGKANKLAQKYRADLTKDAIIRATRVAKTNQQKKKSA